MRRCRVDLLLGSCIVALVAMALLQETPPEGDWLMRLSGDWRQPLPNGYQIGPSVDASMGDTYVITKQVPVATADTTGYAPQTIVDGVESYAPVGDDAFLVKKTKEWILLDTSTGDLTTFNGENLPEDWAEYGQSMRVPEPSMRDPLLFLSVVLAGVLAFRVFRRLGRRGNPVYKPVVTSS